MLEGERAVTDLAHASSLCGACHEVCPVRIDIPRMLVGLRESQDRTGTAPRAERAAFRTLGRVLGSPRLFRIAVRLARLAQRPWLRDGRLRTLPLVARRWTRTRDLPPVAASTFSEWWEREGRRP